MKQANNDLPDFHRIDEKEVKEVDFPVSTAEEYRVYFDAEAYNKMKEHAATTDEVEICGILVGDVCKDREGCYLKVTGAIEGEAANNLGAQVTLTHETWNHVYKIKDELYPEDKIIGWYHTHPGFGVFLSEMDVFIQKNFFSQPYQVAVVIETKRHEEGCFAWVEGEPVPLNKYWVGEKKISLVGCKDGFESLQSREEAAQKASSPPPNMPIREEALGISGFSLVMMLILGFAGGWLVFGGTNSQLFSLVIDAAESELDSLTEYISTHAIVLQDLTNVEEKLKAVEEQASDEKVKQELAELRTSVNNWKQGYAKRRSTFRRDMVEVSRRRPLMNDRIEHIRTHSEEVEKMVGDLYILRIRDIVGQFGKFAPEKISEEDRIVLHSCVDKLLKISPVYKMPLDTYFPGLLDYLYPQPKEIESEKQKQGANDEKNEDQDSEE